MPAPMCGPCAAAWSRWMDYRPPLQPTLVTVDNSLRGTLDRRSARAEDTYRLIRQQCAAIRRSCAAGSHAAPRETTLDNSGIADVD